MYGINIERVLDPPEEKLSRHRCFYCGDSLYVGEDVVFWDGDCYHDECFRENVLAIVDAKASVLEEDD